MSPASDGSFVFLPHSIHLISFLLPISLVNQAPWAEVLRKPAHACEGPGYCVSVFTAWQGSPVIANRVMDQE